jgi:hypothetical protein
MGIAFSDRRALLAALFVLALTANAVQFIAAWFFSNPRNSDAMVQFFSGASDKTFEALYFADKCLSQVTNFKVTPGAVFGGLNPVFFAEMAVLFLTFALVALVAYCPSRTAVRESDRILGFLVFSILLIADQARYFATSVDPSAFSFLGPSFTLGPKMFFTWSSYCFHGDIGWLFDVLGYIFMYAAVGLGVAIMSAIVSQFRKDVSENDISKIGENYRFSTICRIYVWLPYFSYFGFAIWLSCTKIDGAASFALRLPSYLNYHITPSCLFSLPFERNFCKSSLYLQSTI